MKFNTQEEFDFWKEQRLKNKLELKQILDDASNTPVPENKGCIPASSIPEALQLDFDKSMFGKTLAKREDGEFLYYFEDVFGFYKGL